MRAFWTGERVGCALPLERGRKGGAQGEWLAGDSEGGVYVSSHCNS
jgi:hypothetical protein